MKQARTAKSALAVLPFSSGGCRLIIAAGLTALATSPSRAAVTFSFNYTDAIGIGFNANGQTGIDRRGALQQAAAYVSSFLAAYNADIVLDVSGSQTNPTTLASAASNFNGGNPGVGFGDRGDVMRKILGGNAADPDPTKADGIVDWNFQDFQWATGNIFQAGELDLISTGIHEITHALGWASGISQNGQDTYSSVLGASSIWAPFDQFVGDSAGVLINTSFELNSARWNAASVGGTGTAGLTFLGPNAVAANGGNPVFLYSPGPWSDGSSGSHLDTDFYNGTNAPLNMMNHNGVASGLDIREFNAIELGILRDIGYTQIVPEPSASLLGVLGVSAFLLRRRRI